MQQFSFARSFFVIVILCLWTMQYLEHYQTFVSTARYWTESFAKASTRGIEDKVLSLPSLLTFGTWMHIIERL